MSFCFVLFPRTRTLRRRRQRCLRVKYATEHELSRARAVERKGSARSLAFYPYMAAATACENVRYVRVRKSESASHILPVVLFPHTQ